MVDVMIQECMGDDILIHRAIGRMPMYRLKEYGEALKAGHKDEICPKCDTVFLAHHHLIQCMHARCGDCPMVDGGPSLLQRLLGDPDVKAVTVRTDFRWPVRGA